MSLVGCDEDTVTSRKEEGGQKGTDSHQLRATTATPRVLPRVRGQIAALIFPGRATAMRATHGVIGPGPSIGPRRFLLDRLIRPLLRLHNGRQHNNGTGYTRNPSCYSLPLAMFCVRLGALVSEDREI